MSTPTRGVVSGSTSGVDEINRPLLAATQVMAHPGTTPTVTVPVVAGRAPDADQIWEYLAEPAEYFGFAIPDRSVLAEAIERYLDAVGGAAGLHPTVMNVMVVECGASTQFVVTGAAVEARRTGAVRIDVCDAAFPLTRAGDPLWRRMAARTTSKAQEDRLRRWLDARGCVDAVSRTSAPGVPFLGAFVFEQHGELCGVDNVEPTSILDQLHDCGAIGSVRRVDRLSSDVQQVWWISADYQRHPVAAIGNRCYAVDDDAGTDAGRMP